MILADKIISLRKRFGWSQEELAEKLSVSRQAVSKWESGNSIPDMEKVVNMSSLFGVSTDFLLKDEMEVETPSETDDTAEGRKNISVEEANGFMDMTAAFSVKMAMAVQALVLSPVVLLVLTAFAESKKFDLTEDKAAGIGMVVLMVIVAVGVSILISAGTKLERYDYIKKSSITLQYGVRGIVEKKREEFASAYSRGVTAGVVLCIVSVIPLLMSSIADNDALSIICVAILLIFVSCGVHIFVRVGTIEDSYKALLQEDDYSEEAKQIEKQLQFFPGIYWCTVTAIYLGISFYWSNWDRSWIIWPVAGVLFAAVRGIMVARVKSKKGK